MPLLKTKHQAWYQAIVKVGLTQGPPTVNDSNSCSTPHDEGYNRSAVKDHIAWSGDTSGNCYVVPHWSHVWHVCYIIPHWRHMWHLRCGSPLETHEASAIWFPIGDTCGI